MTLKEASQQLFSLTGGRVNGETFTRSQLESNIASWTRDMSRNTIKNHYVITVSLPDGEWYAALTKTTDGYDYFIPETREQEKALITAFFHGRR